MISFYNQLAKDFALPAIDDRTVIEVTQEDSEYHLSVWLKYDAAKHQAEHMGENEDGFRWKKLTGTETINQKPF